MSEIPFHQTRMGQIYYERTMPDLVRQLGRLNDVLEKLVDRLPNGPSTEQIAGAEETP